MVTIPPINMVILGMVYGFVLTTFYENETKTDISWYSEVAILHSFVGVMMAACPLKFNHRPWKNCGCSMFIPVSGRTYTTYPFWKT